ncbi:MAG: glycosyltransferase family 2 protein [Acidobacteria bacterium]|nr:MAG: glycosyltransferase family 2 protein [Acidobacteriota bacterium]
MFPFRCSARYPLPVTLSVVIITYNEEANIGRALESVMPLLSGGKGEIIVVDSGSTDRTVEIAKSFGAKVYVEEWKGYAGQKNSAIDKATGEYILSLDADEEVNSELADEIESTVRRRPAMHKVAQKTPDGHLAPLYVNGFWISRSNYFLRRWIKHGGFWPDRKLRLFRRGAARFKDALVHETLELQQSLGAGITATPRHLRGALIHHSYPTLSDYIDHMNRYSSLGAEMVAAKGKVGFSVHNIVLRPMATFIYNYFFRLGFLDGREGLLLHLHHAVYVYWKYAKAWELSRLSGEKS